MHTVIDDHFRMAYAEICTDEKAAAKAAETCRVTRAPVSKNLVRLRSDWSLLAH